MDLTAWQQVLYEQIRQTGVQKKILRGNGDVAAPPISRGLNNVLMQLRRATTPSCFGTCRGTVDESLIRLSGSFAC